MVSLSILVIPQNLDPLYDVLVEPLGYDALLLEYHGLEYPDLPEALLLFSSSRTLFMEGTERIDSTEQSSPNSPGWKGRMWTDGTKEELSLLSAGYI